jgi:hypothetical protein
MNTSLDTFNHTREPIIFNYIVFALDHDHNFKKAQLMYLVLF